MAENAFPYLGLELESIFCCFEVLPFGLSSAPWIFTTVIGHCVKFLRFQGKDLMAYLDDVIFATGSARGAVATAQQTFHVVRRDSGPQIFTALGTLVDLATQMYAVPAVTQGRIRACITALLTSPSRVCVHTVARLKGLMASTWVATGPATRVRTRPRSSLCAAARLGIL